MQNYGNLCYLPNVCLFAILIEVYGGKTTLPSFMEHKERPIVCSYKQQNGLPIVK